MPFNRLNHSVLGEIRPRFYLKTNSEVEDCLLHLEQNVKKDPSIDGERSRDLIFLKTPINVQHYWSPEMTVRISRDEDEAFTKVSCLIGPRQSVWVFFTLIYAAIAVATFFAGIFGLVQFTRSGTSLWLWTIPVGLLLVASIIIVSKIGQQKGRDQMLHLVSFVYHSIDEIGEVERLVVK